MKVEELNNLIKGEKIDVSQLSDGCHTFEELYAHRNWLFIVLCKNLIDTLLEDKIYKTRFDFENKYCGDGWFIMGINNDKGKQISYHLPIKLWEECSFAKTVDKVPAFDGHTSVDVLNRLEKYY